MGKISRRTAMAGCAAVPLAATLIPASETRIRFEDIPIMSKDEIHDEFEQGARFAHIEDVVLRRGCPVGTMIKEGPINYGDGRKWYTVFHPDKIAKIDPTEFRWAVDESLNPIRDRPTGSRISNHRMLKEHEFHPKWWFRPKQPPLTTSDWICQGRINGERFLELRTVLFDSDGNPGIEPFGKVIEWFVWYGPLPELPDSMVDVIYNRAEGWSARRPKPFGTRDEECHA